jgi:hypothetical protein
MSLRRSPVRTEAMLRANRANAQRSTGPRTERGKLYSSPNAGQHWGRAEAFREFMPALGENPEDFEKLCQGFLDSLQPRDAFETALVTDLAEIQWRLRRMIRGEAAWQARARRQRQAQEEAREAGLGAGKLSDRGKALVPQLGFALTDSPVKFLKVIGFMKAIDRLVQSEGFVPEGEAYLKGLYGSNSGLRGDILILAYEKGIEHEKAGGADAEAARREFGQRMAKEIAWFEERRERDREARAELKAPRVESGLLEGRYNGLQVSTSQDRLERAFERKWRILMRYRMVHRPPAAEEGEAAAAAPIGDTLPDEQAAGSS